MKDRIRLIALGCILSITVFPAFIYFVFFYLSSKFPNLGSFFFYQVFAYLMLFNYVIFKDLKKEKGKYFKLALLTAISIEILIIFVVGLFFYLSSLKEPESGGVWIGSIVTFAMSMLSYLIYNRILSIIKKSLRKRDKAKGIVDLNKFQEKARKKILEVLKSTGTEFEEFKKIEKENEIFLQSDIEINGRPFMIEISEEAITLAAEKEEDALILELIDFQNSNQLIDEFCKKTKEIFKKIK